jgi:hypothetical protein
MIGQYLSDKDLIKYVQNEKNGLKQKQKAGEVDIIITYRPTDLLVIQELGEQRTTSAIEIARKKFQQYYYFMLSLSKNGKEALHQNESYNQYSDLVQKLSFRLPEYVTMTTLNDTIPVADFYLNRTFGLASSTDLLIVFEKAKAKNSETIQININEFGMNTGNCRFKFRKSDIDECPVISIKEQ